MLIDAKTCPHCGSVMVQEDQLTSVQIIGAVARFYRLERREIQQKVKHKRVSWPRAVAQFFMRQHTKLSYPEIAACFDQHHTTVIANTKRVESALVSKPEARSELARVERQIALLSSATATPERRR